MAPSTLSVPSVRPTFGSARSVVRRACVVALAATASVAVAPSTAAANTVQVTPPPIEKSLSTKQTSVRVAVKNTGKKRLTGLSLTVRPAKGVRVRVVGAKKGRSTTRTLKPLAAGKTARVTVRLQRLKGGPKKGAVTVRVQRKKRTIGSERLRFGVPPKNLNTLAGRYFWGSTFTLNGIRQETLYFATDGLVYTDDMEGAWATCPAEDEKCRPYQYVAKGNQLTVDGKPAALNGRKLEYDGQNYFEFTAPAPGTRWAGTLTYSNSSGICPLYCTYFTEHLQFNADGTFVRNGVVSGTGPVVDWATVPPENRGTYEVGADKLLHLAFADGKMRVETAAVYVGDDGKPQSPLDGLILDGDGYFDISKD